MKKIEEGKVLIVPDVHQNIEFVYKALEESFDHVVFIGDWFDTHKEDKVFGFSATVDAVNKLFHDLGDKATWLVGNHDVAYISTYKSDFTKARVHEWYWCSGVTNSKVKKFSKYINPNWFDVQELAVKVGDFVVSHAGFNVHFFMPSSEGLRASEMFAIENLTDSWAQTRRDFHHMNSHWIWAVGRSRGGFFPAGSPVWQDWAAEFVPFDNVSQIVGHTCKSGFHNIRQKHFNGHKNYCIDVDQKAYAIWENGDLTFRSMENGSYYREVDGIFEKISSNS